MGSLHPPHPEEVKRNCTDEQDNADRYPHARGSADLTPRKR
jgi:hypothetical protein